MKITGPGQPPNQGVPEGPGAGPDKSTKPDRSAKSEGVGSPAGVADPAAPDARKTGTVFAEKVAGTSATPSSEVSAPRRAGDVSVQDLAAELKAGRLDAKAAVDKIIDRVVGVQLGPTAPAHVRAQVQAALRDALESDPLLAEKLRGLE